MRLRELRESKNLSQADIAKILKVKQSTYSRYENGERNIDIETLTKLANFYGVSLDYIVKRNWDI